MNFVSDLNIDNRRVTDNNDDAYIENLFHVD